MSDLLSLLDGASIPIAVVVGVVLTLRQLIGTFGRDLFGPRARRWGVDHELGLTSRRRRRRLDSSEDDAYPPLPPAADADSATRGSPARRRRRRPPRRWPPPS